MEKLVIQGPVKTKGSLKVSGAKNSAVAILPAALLANSAVTVENVPAISDIHVQVEIIKSLGASVTWTGKDTLLIDPSKVQPKIVSYDVFKKLRASYYLMGVLLGRFERGKVPAPGGCDLGPRPIDQHLKGFSALGADIKVNQGLVEMEALKLRGSKIYLDVVSVGATINIMLAAVQAEGKTVIVNCAKEPEIVDVANFLNSMGGSVRGAGTDVIRVQGVEVLRGTTHSIIPDRIEAGTYMLAAAVSGGEVLLEDVIPKHLESIIAKLKEAGVTLEVGEDTLLVRAGKPLQAVDVKTFPYPGFPTDLQSLMMVLLTQAEGIGIISENVFESRFRHVDELKRLGANIKVEGRSAVVQGRTNLTACPVRASDLRAGAACLIAALVAEGETEISGLDHIDRGYEGIEKNLVSLGVDIKRVDG